MEDEEAQFGPRIDVDSPIMGRVYSAKPLDGCVKEIPLPVNYSPRAIPYISLIRRGNCTFEKKVRAAARGGYIAAIIFNHINDAIFPMAGQSSGLINISSVMIGLTNGLKVMNEVKDSPQNYVVEIYPNHESNLEVYLIPVLSLFGLFILGVLGLCILRWCERRRRLRYRCLTSGQVRRLPTTKFKQRQNPDGSCAICLEDYKDGDRLRSLPCDHAYHTKCIDPWLLKNSRVCPICKRVVFPRRSRSPSRCACSNCLSRESGRTTDDDLENRLMSDTESFGDTQSADSVPVVSAYPSTSYGAVTSLSLSAAPLTSTFPTESTPLLAHGDSDNPVGASAPGQFLPRHSSPSSFYSTADASFVTSVPNDSSSGTADVSNSVDSSSVPFNNSVSRDPNTELSESLPGCVQVPVIVDETEVRPTSPTLTGPAYVGPDDTAVSIHGVPACSQSPNV